MESYQFQPEQNEKEYFSELVNKALEGKHSDFEFIKNIYMHKTARLYKRGIKKVIKVFKALIKGLTKAYSKGIQNETDRFDMILALKQFDACLIYYKQEYAIATDMLAEYREYVLRGHILKQFVFMSDRPEEECIDYRCLTLF